MSKLNPQEAQSRLIEVLGKSVKQALGLKESLEDEKKALEAQDLDALDLAVTSKGICLAELQSLEQTRAGICIDAGFEPSQMQAVAEWCDDDAVVENCWNHLIELATDCNSLNLTNGNIIRMRQAQMGNRLAILRGNFEAPATYQRSGNGPAPANRSLAEA